MFLAMDDLEKEWADLAPAFIKRVREGDPVRDGLLDPLMLDACGVIQGQDVLECGCGEGRFCRMLVARGANYVLGLDRSPVMIEAASDMRSGHDEYVVADVQDLSFLENQIFDLGVSYMNQCDLPDFEANTRGVFRVLRSGGMFVIANLHPMRSAVGLWHKAPDGTKQHAILDDYFDEAEQHWTMLGMGLTNFHRSLSTYMNSFINCGFSIEHVVEPTVTDEQLKTHPDLVDELRVPNFIIYVLRKP